MANPLFNAFGGNQQNNMLMEIQNFKNKFANINPRTEVERLLNSGQMSQAQFNQLAQQAQQIVQMFGLRQASIKSVRLGSANKFIL